MQLSEYSLTYYDSEEDEEKTILKEIVDDESLNENSLNIDTFIDIFAELKQKYKDLKYSEFRRWFYNLVPSF